jgi:hypothetical protein
MYTPDRFEESDLNRAYRREHAALLKQRIDPPGGKPPMWDTPCSDCGEGRLWIIEFRRHPMVRRPYPLCSLCADKRRTAGWRVERYDLDESPDDLFDRQAERLQYRLAYPAFRWAVIPAEELVVFVSSAACDGRTYLTSHSEIMRRSVPSDATQAVLAGSAETWRLVQGHERSEGSVWVRARTDAGSGWRLLRR